MAGITQRGSSASVMDPWKMLDVVSGASGGSQTVCVMIEEELARATETVKSVWKLLTLQKWPSNVRCEVATAKAHCMAFAVECYSTMRNLRGTIFVLFMAGPDGKRPDGEVHRRRQLLLASIRAGDTVQMQAFLAEIRPFVDGLRANVQQLDIHRAGSRAKKTLDALTIAADKAREFLQRGARAYIADHAPRLLSAAASALTAVACVLLGLTQPQVLMAAGVVFGVGCAVPPLLLRRADRNDERGARDTVEAVCQLTAALTSFSNPRREAVDEMTRWQGNDLAGELEALWRDGSGDLQWARCSSRDVDRQIKDLMDFASSY